MGQACVCELPFMSGSDEVPKGQITSSVGSKMTDAEKEGYKRMLQSGLGLSDDEKKALDKMHAEVSKDEAAAAETRVKVTQIKLQQLKVLNDPDRAEEKKKLTDIYCEIDVNNDGDVSLEELTAIFPTAATMFAHMDVDSDKKISMGEFLHFMDSKLNQDPEKGMHFIQYLEKMQKVNADKIAAIAKKKVDAEKALKAAAASKKAAEEALKAAAANKKAAEEAVAAMQG